MTSAENGSCAMSYIRALRSTTGLKAGWAVTSCTRSPSIQTSRPSPSRVRYSSPVRIMICSLLRLVRRAADYRSRSLERNGRMSFDDLVGAGEQQLGDLDAYGTRHFAVDNELEPDRLLGRRVTRRRPLQYLVGQGGEHGPAFR